MLKRWTILGLFSLAGSVFFGLGGCGGPGASAPVGNSKATFQDAVEKAGGDYSKLSPEDQKMADTASRGHGVQFVKNSYKARHP